jgi:hypothetical protein
MLNVALKHQRGKNDVLEIAARWRYFKLNEQLCLTLLFEIGNLGYV